MWKESCLILGDSRIDLVESYDHMLMIVRDLMRIGVHHFYTDFKGTAIQIINIMIEKNFAEFQNGLQKTLILDEPVDPADKSKRLPPYFDDQILVSDKYYNGIRCEQFMQKIGCVVVGDRLDDRQRELVELGKKSEAIFYHLWPFEKA